MNTKLLAVKGAIVSAATFLGTSVRSFAAGAKETTTTAAATDFTAVSTPIVELINSLLVPALAIVGALGTLYCILLGVKYARAEEPQEHEKAKKALKNAIIGFVLIFVLMLALKLGMPILQNWVVRFAK